MKTVLLFTLSFLIISCGGSGNNNSTGNADSCSPSVASTPNSIPVFTSSSILSALTTTSEISKVEAVDSQEDTLCFRIVESGDGSLVEINSNTGDLSFIDLPARLRTEISDQDDQLNVTVAVSDGEFEAFQNIIINLEEPSLILNWDNVFGGSGEEWNTQMISNGAGGFVAVTGTTSSSSGDISEISPGNLHVLNVIPDDIWVFSGGASGNLNWSDVIGGNYYEDARTITRNTSGDYLIASVSNSNINGDRTAPSISPYVEPSGAEFNSNDTWFVKLDSAGNILWDKAIEGPDFGEPGVSAYGFSDAPLYSIATQDGGYIIIRGGLIRNTGRNVIKINSSGNLVWEANIDGMLTDLVELPDGNFAFVGFNENELATGAYGDVDAWLVIYSSDGLLLQSKRFGGNLYDAFSKVALVGNDLVIVGHSESSVSGNKTSQQQAGNIDAWIVKLDSEFNSIWQFSYGGNGSDYFNHITTSEFNTFLISGTTSSSDSGDVESKILGGSDTWVVWLTDDGYMIAEDTFGTLNTDGGGDIVSGSQDSFYIMTPISSSDFGGDLTDTKEGGNDLWLVSAKWSVTSIE